MARHRRVSACGLAPSFDAAELSGNALPRGLVDLQRCVTVPRSVPAVAFSSPAPAGTAPTLNRRQGRPLYASRVPQRTRNVAKPRRPLVPLPPGVNP